MGTRESKTAAEKGGKKLYNFFIHVFFVLAGFLFKKEFICYKSE